ncbi:MAG: hypothetical protein PHV75_04235 [Victivallaceae bacterium]|jgi:hypothetical protein|nr:hypothetical protein [Victivallaceae bacterium]MDD3703312.1 hypothetical protein [Victivallaceae bacterium]MDD4317707.1 hypothetical protein [Victivallaceae bacterium]NLK82874.1 hypothetical protein [Lentisphaerota bacterium]
MNKILLFISCAAVAVLLNGCATAMSNNQYTVNIANGQNQERTFRIYNRNGKYIHMGKTPMMVTLRAQSDKFFAKEIYNIKFDGGKERTITATLTPWYWGNCINIFGFIVDGFTGSMWALPDRVNIDIPESADPDSQKINL